MKALSVKPLWATGILMEWKRIEWRSWKTDYRGPLLICASSGPWYAGTICKHALCVVELVDIIPFDERCLDAAAMDEMPDKPGYAWLLGRPCYVVPFEVKGKLHLFDVNDELIKTMDDVGIKSSAKFAERYYKPLMRWEDREMSRDLIEEDWNTWMGYLTEQDAERGVDAG